METAQDVVDRIKAREKERSYLLAVLDLWAKVQAQGIEVGSVRSFGFDGRLLTPEQKRRQHLRIQPGVDQYIEVLATGRRRPRVYNYARHRDGTQTILNPMLEAVYEHDD